VPAGERGAPGGAGRTHTQGAGPAGPPSACSWQPTDPCRARSGSLRKPTLLWAGRFKFLLGAQYRSAIFYASPEQKATAETVIADLTRAKTWDAPIVTEVTPLDAFYPAERYHQDYYRRNPNQGYCQIVIAPKVAKARRAFLSKLKREG